MFTQQQTLCGHDVRFVFLLLFLTFCFLFVFVTSNGALRDICPPRLLSPLHFLIIFSYIQYERTQLLPLYFGKKNVMKKKTLPPSNRHDNVF